MHRRAWLSVLFLVGTVALVAQPFSSPSAGAPPIPPAPARSTAPLPAVVARSVGPAPGSPALPGENPAPMAWINAPRLAVQEWSAAKNASNSAPPIPSATATPGPSPRASVRPMAAPGGNITGRIFDETHGRPIAGANVSVQPFGTTYCTPTPCASNLTDQFGDFTVASPAGAVELLFSAPLYLTNRTWVTVPSGGVLGVGTLYLLHDAIVSGVVETALPSHLPIDGAAVTAASRDATVVTPGTILTAPNGSFTIGVPPLPSVVTISSPGNTPLYLQNETWVNLTPYETYDLGVIYLEGGLTINATLVDAETGLPILSISPSALTVCSRRANLCLPQLLGGRGSNVSGIAMPGAVTIKAFAIGYLVNTTTVADLPNSDTTIDVGRIEMVPLAGIEISSNFTGGPPPSSGWPLPNLTAFVCSLTGELVTYALFGGPLSGSPCWPRANAVPGFAENNVTLGATTVLLGPPLHDIVDLQQNADTSASTIPDFPIATDTWAGFQPMFPPAFSNMTWINATPDRITVAGSVDVTPGTYLQGNVSLSSVVGSIDGRFEVRVCSTEAPELCGSTVGSSDLQGPVIGCHQGSATFCVPSPPGPVEITVTQIDPGYTNHTWVEVPRGCCGQDGHPLDVGWINLTLPPLYGAVNGSVVAQIGGPGSGTTPIPAVLVSVQACPVGPPPNGAPTGGCTAGTVNLSSGEFNLTAALGWDEVSVTATGYTANRTWVDVTGANSTGTIDLAPLAAFVGQVRTPTGSGIVAASVAVCAAATPLLCDPIGTTNTNGQYNGSAAGGPLPWGTYQVFATGPGYEPSWTWTNSTPGAVTRVPPIVLYPIGSSVPAPGSARPQANTSVAAWVDGRLVDSRSGLGVPDAQISECLISTGGCTGGSGMSTVGGTFNLSLLLGQYDLEVNATGYPTTTFYVNATQVTVVHLGDLSMRHLAWVRGRALIAPWESLGPTEGLGASVQVIACPSVGHLCLPPQVTDTGGFFNVSVPNGGSAVLLFVGRANDGYGTAVGGWQFTTANVYVTGYYTMMSMTGPGAPVVGIFGSVSGRLADGSTWNTTDQAARRPCSFCSVIVNPVGSLQSAYQIEQTAGGGNYTEFVPSDTTGTMLTGIGSTYWWTNETIPGNISNAASVTAPPITMPHYGWITFQTIDANTSAPVPYVAATVSRNDPANFTVFSTTGSGRNDGFMNVTAPVGPSVGINITAAGYFLSSQTVSVRQSETVGLGLVRLVGGAPSSVVYIRSAAVTTLNTTPTPTVVDARTRAALPGVAVAATTVVGSASATVYTNGLGQFLLPGAAVPTQGIYVSFEGYVPLSMYFNTSSGATVTVPFVNLTGDGIVAGRVLAQPGKSPVPNTEVDVCPTGLPGCGSVGYTNATGYFWVAAPPGADTVTIVSPAYLTNVTVGLTVSSDRWQWVGAIPVYAFASISGALRGIPSGDRLTNGNVSVCSPFGVPTGPCGLTVPTDLNGSFFVPAPPAQYILMFQAPGYNTSYLPVDLLPGENLSVGTILLIAYGYVAGRVVSGLTGAPLPNATVVVCSQTTAGLCSPFVHVGAAGDFNVLAPPGDDLLTATAPGFFDNYTAVYVPAGMTAGPLTITELPVAVNIPESLSGSVVAADRAGAPVPGAFVSANLLGVPVASGSTDAAGRFTLALTWGTYTLVASAPGYATVRSTVVVHSNLTGYVIALPTMTFGVTGVVRDALTGTPLNAVQLLENGSVLATSGSTGAYVITLANGTYDLVAHPTAATGGAYGDLPFSVIVTGRAISRDLDLTPSIAAVTGFVVDADSGLPIVGATVAAFAAGSTARVALATVTTGGSFSLALSAGTFYLNVSAPGYTTASVAISVPVAGGPLTIPLAPLPSTSTLGGVSLPWPILAGAAAGTVIAVAAVVIYWRRRPPPPPPLPRWTLEDLDEGLR